jgi:hypothetical protein
LVGEIVDFLVRPALIIPDTVQRIAACLLLPVAALVLAVLLALPRAMPAAAITANAPPTPDAQQLRHDILSDPNLQQREATVTPSPVQLPDLPPINLSFLRWVFIGAGAVLIIILIALLGPLIFHFFSQRRRRRAQSNPGDELAIATSEEAVQRAQEASALQDYRQALRLLYLASLLKLDEIGALRYDHALTNREYVRRVALRPALADALRPVVETFDDVWYGYRPLTSEGYATFAAQVDTLMKTAENGEASGEEKVETGA